MHTPTNSMELRSRLRGKWECTACILVSENRESENSVETITPSG